MAAAFFPPPSQEGHERRSKDNSEGHRLGGSPPFVLLLFQRSLFSLPRRKFFLAFLTLVKGHYIRIKAASRCLNSVIRNVRLVNELLLSAQ